MNYYTSCVRVGMFFVLIVFVQKMLNERPLFMICWNFSWCYSISPGVNCPRLPYSNTNRIDPCALYDNGAYLTLSVGISGNIKDRNLKHREFQFQFVKQFTIFQIKFQCINWTGCADSIEMSIALVFFLKWNLWWVFKNVHCFTCKIL